MPHKDYCLLKILKSYFRQPIFLIVHYSYLATFFAESGFMAIPSVGLALELVVNLSRVK